MKKQKKILIVEDGDFSVKIYTHLLTDAGYEVINTPKASEAARIADESSPSLIIMDLMLQDGNGFDAIKQIRQNKKLQKTPILVLSNLSQDSDIKEAMDSGADKYFVKSNVKFQQIIETINEMVK